MVKQCVYFVKLTSENLALQATFMMFQNDFLNSFPKDSFDGSCYKNGQYHGWILMKDTGIIEEKTQIV